MIFNFRAQDWKEALYWYNAALNMTDYDEGGEYDGTQDEPRYLLLAREAEMLMTGGFHLDKDPQRSGKSAFFSVISNPAFPSRPRGTPKINFLIQLLKKVERISTLGFVGGAVTTLG